MTIVDRDQRPGREWERWRGNGTRDEERKVGEETGTETSKGTLDSLAFPWRGTRPVQEAAARLADSFRREREEQVRPLS